jgi:hypothetical protein
METQATYTVSPQLPTLTELQAQLAEWLAIGLSLAADMALVIREYGQEKSEHDWHYYELQDGNLRAVYLEKVGAYLVDQNRFSLSTRIGITVGLYQVCNLTITDDPEEETWQNVFVPGDWVQRLLSRLSAAKAQAEERQANEDLNKRLALARRLLIGKKV